MKSAAKLFALISLLLFLLSAAFFAGAVERRAQRREQARETASETQHYYPCVLKSENGRVLLYPMSGTGAPAELGISCGDLPPEDRAMLETGIRIEDEKELFSLMEDYTN